MHSSAGMKALVVETRVVFFDGDARGHGAGESIMSREAGEGHITTGRQRIRVIRVQAKGLRKPQRSSVSLAWTHSGELESVPRETKTAGTCRHNARLCASSGPATDNEQAWREWLSLCFVTLSEDLGVLEGAGRQGGTHWWCQLLSTEGAALTTGA